MSVLYIVLPVTLVIVGVAIGAYTWAARAGQFDDLTTPAMRMLFDDPAVKPADLPPVGRRND